MFMNCIGTFDFIVGRKEDENVICELICELCVSYEFYKGTIESYALISMSCAQWLMGSVKSTFIELDNEVWEVGSVPKQKQQKLGHSSISNKCIF